MCSFILPFASFTATTHHSFFTLLHDSCDPMTFDLWHRQPASLRTIFFFFVAVRKSQRFIPAVSSVPYLMSLHLHHGARWKCRPARIALFYHMFTPVFIKYWHPFTVTFRCGARDAAHRRLRHTRCLKKKKAAPSQSERMLLKRHEGGNAIRVRLPQRCAVTRHPLQFLQKSFGWVFFFFFYVKLDSRGRFYLQNRFLPH